MYTVNETYKNIEAEFKPRSKWDHGVKDPALALLDSLDMPETVLPDHFGSRHALLLNGADNWREYSYGGVRSRVQRGYRRPVLYPVRNAPVHG